MKRRNKFYQCKDCKREVRERAVSQMLVDLRLCPQCYTKKYAPSPTKEY